MRDVEYIPAIVSLEPFVDKHAVADYLGMSVKWVEKQSMDRRFPSHRIGGRRKYRLSEIRDWAEGKVA